MRSRVSHTITSQDVHSWAIEWLVQAKLLKDHGWLCTAAVVWNLVLRAAARSISIPAACRDLSGSPSDQAIMNALREGLPQTLCVLERRLNEALTCALPRRLRRRAWQLAIDWHLSPYYGEPHRSRNELYYGKPRQGTKKFHAYASACIVSHGHRYTLALTWVRRHESTVVVLRRLLAKIREIGLKIKRVLVDRAFFNVPVVEFLQQEKLPFLMPVMFRGRPPKRPGKARGLQAIKQQPAGWYRHTMKNRQKQVTVQVCVGYRRHRNRKDGKQVKQKLLFAAWRVHGTPTEIRNRYRQRFGIETSFRQMRQARIYTCTRDPHLRLLFVAVALILRNLWVWIHQTCLAAGTGDHPTLHLERLRFKRMLDWIVHQIVAVLHDGSTPCVETGP
ncbi:MAG TPA: transposase [Terriglobales bacterium]|nr:transposase [Terriglobales bacterium]